MIPKIHQYWSSLKSVNTKGTPLANKGEDTPQPLFTLTYKYTSQKQSDNLHTLQGISIHSNIITHQNNVNHITCAKGNKKLCTFKMELH